MTHSVVTRDDKKSNDDANKSRKPNVLFIVAEKYVLQRKLVTIIGLYPIFTYIDETELRYLA